MNAACWGRVDGLTASPSTTTNPESVGSDSTPAGGGSLGSMNTSPQTGNTQVTAPPAAAPPRTNEASVAPTAAEGGTVPVGSAVGSSPDGVAAGAFVAPGARVYFVGRYLDHDREQLTDNVPEGESFEVGRKQGSPFEHDRYVERYHAALLPTRDGVMVEDFGAQNGVFVRICAPTPIEDGDQFRIGEELLAVRALSLPDEAGVKAIGCPDPGYWARIDMLLRPDLVAASYPVDEAEALMGRDEGSIQFPDDPAVSGAHCRLRVEDDRILLEDLASEHGTFVRLRPRMMVPYGSTLLIGETLLRVERNG